MCPFHHGLNTRFPFRSLTVSPVISSHSIQFKSKLVRLFSFWRKEHSWNMLASLLGSGNIIKRQAFLHLTWRKMNPRQFCWICHNVLWLTPLRVFQLLSPFQTPRFPSLSPFLHNYIQKGTLRELLWSVARVTADESILLKLLEKCYPLTKIPFHLIFFPVSTVKVFVMSHLAAKALLCTQEKGDVRNVMY